MTNQLFGLEFFVVRQDIFYPHQDYEQVNFYKKSSLYFIDWFFRNWKIAADLQLVINWNIEFIDSLKNNGTKYLLIFDDSCEEICNSEAFVDIVTAGRHRGLSTIYIKHNLFHQSKLGRDVELENTHIVLFESPHDVMQVTTLNTQLGLGSELVDWYRDATSVPFGHFSIDLLPRTDDRLRYFTNSGSVLSKFYIPEQLKHLKTLNDEHTKSLSTLQVFQSLSRECESHFLQSCPKEFVRFLCECIVNLLKGNLQTTKRHHVVKFRDEMWLLTLKEQLGSKEETFCRQKKDCN